MHDTSGIKLALYKLSLLIPDSVYLRLKFRKNFGRWPNLRNPQTFNEKLNWLKLHDRNPLYTRMVDKYEAKNYVASIIGDEYIIPTYGVWNRGEDIDFDSLPDKFVLKATHDSGRVIIYRDKSKLDKSKAVREMNESLKRNFFAVTREWPYKNVKPRIIAEKLLETPSNEELAGKGYSHSDNNVYDYKFFCFNGRVKFMKVDFDRQTNHGANYYDRDFNLLEIEEAVDCPRNPEKGIERPKNFELMIELAEKIANGHKFLRVDFYEVNGNVYFGETTFYPASGMGKLGPDNADLEIGKLLKL